MAGLGLTEAQVREQLRFFHRPQFHLELARPCTPGDGILRLPAWRHAEYLLSHAAACRAGRFLKFVPASGAASRMFQAPLRYLKEVSVIRDPGNPGPPPPLAWDRQVEAFCLSLKQFAFFPDLAAAMAAQGLDVEEVMARGEFHCVLHCLLSDRGLNYASLPKGLLKFHLYGAEGRTALEEHLVEAALYTRDGSARCRLHFTVQPEHREWFAELLHRALPCWEGRLGCRFQVEFSVQSHATDTLAVDLENRPFREEDGRLHFRPGGHGALLQNLQDSRGDLVYIKNIDNVVPDRLKEPTVYWKKIMGGMLAHLQGRLHDYLRRLHFDPPDPESIREAADFARDQLHQTLPADWPKWPPARQRDFLSALFDRPLRVCGVVENQGEPGGAPFWVRDPDGSLSLQIVESAQVNLDSPEQKAIWEASTHFNPVDLVVTLRDWQGHPFDLGNFVDPEAVFISRKSRHGRDLKALELPGLWNGAMARWLTLFVEVPLITFNPVKTALDLLRPEHLP